MESTGDKWPDVAGGAPTRFFNLYHPGAKIGQELAAKACFLVGKVQYLKFFYRGCHIYVPCDNNSIEQLGCASSYGIITTVTTGFRKVVISLPQFFYYLRITIDQLLN